MPLISAEVLEPINTVRGMLNEEVASAPPSSGDLTVQLLEGKVEGLLTIDSTARIEVSIAKALNAGPGEKQMIEELLEVLPSADKHFSVNESVVQVKQLLESHLCKFCSATTQQKIEEINSALLTIQRGHSPAFTTWGGDALLKKIKDEIIPLFLRVEPVNLETDAMVPMRGRPAAAHLLRVAEEARERDMLDLAQIQILTTYDFLLSPTENELIQTWLAEIWKNAGLAGATAINAARKASKPASSSSSAPAPKKAKSATAPPAETMDNIANLFS